MVRRHALAAACALVLIAANADAQKRIGEPFELGVGESVLITDAGIHVGFDWVLSDSRCPRGVDCIWEGTAVALVWGEISPAHRTFFELNTNPRFQSEAPFAGFIIRLLAVAPYPEDGVIIDPSDYVVTMVVEREGTVPFEAKSWGAIKELFK